MFANPHGVEVLPKPLFAMLADGTRWARPARRRGRAPRAARWRRRAPEGAPRARRRRPVQAHRVEGERTARAAARPRDGARGARHRLARPRCVRRAVGRRARLGAARRRDRRARRRGCAAHRARAIASGSSSSPRAFARGSRRARAPSRPRRSRAALASAASMVDSDRCELDEAELAARVAEHLRPLDPRGLSDVPRGNLEALSVRAEAMRIARAVRAASAPGVDPPRAALPALSRLVRRRGSSARRGRARARRRTAARHLREARTREEPEEAPEHRARMGAAAGAREQHGGRPCGSSGRDTSSVRWTMPSFEPGLTSHPSGPATVEDVVLEAVRIRVRASQSRAERAMRSLGVRPKNIEVRRHGVRTGSEGHE